MTARAARLLVLLLLLATVGVTGCGGDDDPGGGGSATARSPEGPDETDTAPEADLKDTSTKPVVTVPAGSPPRRLQKEDIVKGKGPPAKDGDTVSIQYVDVSFATGEEVDASWDRGHPFTFTLGKDKVIKGWEKGIKGMRKGGRRELVIPPEQAYGAQGSPPEIGPNETLIFVVDLVDIR
ncbi:MAG TPA: FKBP-type peptidyl-prolyl cis-trans isomerase [Thermoleophilaceae bacterium]|jgi:peptidylprolyl isomerase